MIRHIALFSAKDPKHIDLIAKTLAGYSKIPGVKNFEVSKNRKIDALENDVDVILHAQFETEADLDAYKAHPIYLNGIEVVRPIRELRIAVDYDSSDIV
ncbi:Dabb family protein [Lentilitoribacter sp. EG35]|jgi:hypothetical protein|uniref:Dabb family protein n=1 Tax=Lentilitoribacter sp. EG35 TaxID=3234192 RepID=UPI003460CC0D